MVDTKCPLCDSLVEETEATVSEEYLPPFPRRGQPLPRRERQTRVAACTGCEFLIDLRRPDGVPKTSAQLLTEVGRWLMNPAAE